MTTVTFKHIDLSYLESLIGDDNETKLVILSTLLEEVPQEIVQLEHQLANQNWKEFHEVSHKLKSTLAYIGNQEIFDANQEMMMCARNLERLDTIPNFLTIVKEKWIEIEPEISLALEEVSTLIS